MSRTIAVFGASRSHPGDEQFIEGVTCGRLLAEAGFAVATGGYGGTMEAVSRGARSAGGDVIGVTAPSVFPDRANGNHHLTTEMRASSLIERIGELTDRTDGAIALRGSLGTAAELLVAWNLALVAPFSATPRKPVVAVGQPWSALVPHLETALEIEPGLVTIVDDVATAVSTMLEMTAHQVD